MSKYYFKVKNFQEHGSETYMGLELPEKVNNPANIIKNALILAKKNSEIDCIEISEEEYLKRNELNDDEIFYSYILEHIVLEDRKKVIEYKEKQEKFKYYPYWECFKCKKRFIVLENYKKRIVTCPHCKEKYKVKIFKNGKWSQSVVNFK